MSDSGQKITFLVADHNRGLRADVIISHQSALSRSQVLKLFHNQKVTVNGHLCRPSYRGEVGDIFAYQKSLEPQTDLIGYPGKLNILFEDEWILVVNKPAHLVVHPAPGHWQDTLVNILVYHKKTLSSGSIKNAVGENVDIAPSRPGIVHRIDQNTSGLLVVAKNALAHQHLARQFAYHTVVRCYWALVFGRPYKPSGQIVSRMARDIKNRQRFQSVTEQADRGKKAVTYYQVISSQNEISLLYVKLKTGRTHQVRVHLSDQNHPILGDWTYAKKKRISALGCPYLQKSVKSLSRLALHAAKLGFIHPYHEKYFEFEVGWPADLLDILSVSRLVK